MTKNSKSLDHEILSGSDAIWTKDPLVALSEEELDRIICLFGALDGHNQTRLRDPVRRVFGSFVTRSAIERGETNDGQVVRPSTAALRDLRKLGERLGAFEDALSDLQQGTRSLIDADLEARGSLLPDGSSLECQELLNLTYAVLDQWHGVARLGELQAGRGPNNAATRKMVEAMANWWEEAHGTRPKTDRGRGLRPDPFLELCQEMTRIARARLLELEIDLGTVKLSGIVADVLKNTDQGRSLE